MAGSGFRTFRNAFVSQFNTAWAASADFTHLGGALAPSDVPIVSPNAVFKPTSEAAWGETDLLWLFRVQDGPSDDRTYRGEGVLQVTFYVQDGLGTDLLDQLSDRCAEIMRGNISLSGLHIYSTSGPGAAPGSPQGYFGEITETNFTWFSDGP